MNTVPFTISTNETIGLPALQFKHKFKDEECEIVDFHYSYHLRKLALLCIDRDYQFLIKVFDSNFELELSYRVSLGLHSSVKNQLLKAFKNKVISPLNSFRLVEPSAKSLHYDFTTHTFIFSSNLIDVKFDFDARKTQEKNESDKLFVHYVSMKGKECQTFSFTRRQYSNLDKSFLRLCDNKSVRRIDKTIKVDDYNLATRTKVTYSEYSLTTSTNESSGYSDSIDIVNVSDNGNYVCIYGQNPSYPIDSVAILNIKNPLNIILIYDKNKNSIGMPSACFEKNILFFNQSGKIDIYDYVKKEKIKSYRSETLDDFYNHFEIINLSHIAIVKNKTISIFNLEKDELIKTFELDYQSKYQVAWNNFFYLNENDFVHLSFHEK